LKVQFAAPLNKNLVDGSWQLSRPFFTPQASNKQPDERQKNQGQTRDKRDKAYSTRRVAGWAPDLPKPYDTWDDLTSGTSK
jgi:hypothetical protein